MTPFWGWIILLIICAVSFVVAARLWREPDRSTNFQGSVADPVFGQLHHQGYGDGDWWLGSRTVDGRVVRFLLDGWKEPDPRLTRRAHDLAAALPAFLAELDAFLAAEATRRPEQAAAIRDLVLTDIALFLGRAADDPDGYSGEFAILERKAQGTQPDAWRCTIEDGTFADLRPWQ